MDKQPPHKSPEAFLADVFGTKLVRDGKVVHRSLRDIEQTRLDRFDAGEALVRDRLAALRASDARCTACRARG